TNIKEMDKNKDKVDKTEHENEKSVRKRVQRVTSLSLDWKLIENTSCASALSMKWTNNSLTHGYGKIYIFKFISSQVANEIYWLIFDAYKDLQILKGIQPKQEKPAAQSFTPYGNFSMIGDVEHYSRNDSDELIKSSVENLVLIPSEFEGISDDTCDVPVCEDPSTFDALNDHSEILSDSNDDGTSSDDDDFEDIEYVRLEEVNDVDQEEKEIDLVDILQIQDVILREKLLNISRLIINIESLKDNPIPNRVLKSPSSVLIFVTDSNSFFEKSDTSFSFLDNSLPEFETFSDHTEETRSGSTTTYANNSLPEYESFLFKIEPDQGGLISIVISDNSNDPLLELPEFESFHFDLYDDPSFPRPPPKPPDV
ncbi:hypothetical protein Tco_0898316, partial [Tanacetum coccineum]